MIVRRCVLCGREFTGARCPNCAPQRAVSVFSAVFGNTARKKIAYNAQQGGRKFSGDGNIIGICRIFGAPPQTARTGIASRHHRTARAVLFSPIAAAAGVQIGAGYIALSDSLIAELHRAAFIGAVISAGAVAFAAAMAFISVRFFRRRR